LAGAKNSTHHIQFDRPEVVVEAIRGVEAARDGGQV
jgi:hypothetical protein